MRSDTAFFSAADIFRRLLSGLRCRYLSARGVGLRVLAGHRAKIDTTNRERELIRERTVAGHGLGLLWLVASSTCASGTRPGPGAWSADVRCAVAPAGGTDGASAREPRSTRPWGRLGGACLAEGQLGDVGAWRAVRLGDPSQSAAGGWAGVEPARKRYSARTAGWAGSQAPATAAASRKTTRKTTAGRSGPPGGSGMVQVQRDLDVQPAASLRDRFRPRGQALAGVHQPGGHLVAAAGHVAQLVSLRSEDLDGERIVAVLGLPPKRKALPGA